MPSDYASTKRLQRIVLVGAAAIFVLFIFLWLRKPPPAQTGIIALLKTEILTARIVPAAAGKDTSIFVDCTMSMRGFANCATNSYKSLIQGLPNIFPSARFYRFADTPVAVDSRQLESAQYPGQGFYSNASGFSNTRIDNVLKSCDPLGLNIIVTDLFEDQGSVNALVSIIGTRWFDKGLGLVVQSVPCDFKGDVYSVTDPMTGANTSSYYYNANGVPANYRPYYILFLGPLGAVRAAHEKIIPSDRDRQQSINLTPSLVKDYQVRFKCEDPRFASAAAFNLLRDATKPDPKKKEKAEDQLILKARGDLEAELPVELMLTRNSGVPGIFRVSVESFLIHKTSKKLADLVNTAGNIELKTGAATVSLTGPIALPLILRAPKTTENYAVKVSVRHAEDFQMPGWVAEWSAEVPPPSKTVNANKTLNLKPFILGLVQTLCKNDPPVAVFGIEIQR